MSKDLELGAEVEYKTSSKKGAVWRKGIIHAIKKAEAVTGPDIILGYLVDTGKDEHVDEFKYSPRDRELTKRVNAAMKKRGLLASENLEEAQKLVDELSKAKDLPKHEILIERNRQPEQIEVSPEDIRLA